FRLAQPLLEARALGVRELALGDVAQVHHHRADPRLVQQVADGVLDPAPRAVLVADAYFLHHDLARLTKGLVALAHRALMVLGVDELEILLAAHLVEAVAGEALEGRADVEDAARARPREEHRVGAVLDHRPEAFFAALHGALAAREAPRGQRDQSEHRRRGEE